MHIQMQKHPMKITCQYFLSRKTFFVRLMQNCACLLNTMQMLWKPNFPDRFNLLLLAKPWSHIYVRNLVRVTIKPEKNPLLNMKNISGTKFWNSPYIFVRGHCVAVTVRSAAGKVINFKNLSGPATWLFLWFWFAHHLSTVSC